ncbi:MAG: FKBP-type peptidyl-prolyl cis-trans isomerase SlyD [Lysobacterales bacterium]|jgi:FKBP-type peptidyl-prolyl cis-trans isomerase SlyD
MTVEKNKIVAFHYTLSNTQGEQLESSRDKDAMEYLHGSNNIIPGLEKAMEGRQAGDEFSVTVEPEEAYGTRSEANIQRIPLKRLGKKMGKPTVGQVLGLQTNQGPVQVTVVKVGKFNIDVDANHPLSGQALTFDVEIVSVRDALEDELGHGHSHGPGGHDHG